MSEIQIIEINRILKAAQAIRLSSKEKKALEMDYKDVADKEGYYQAAYYIVKQRNENTSSTYPPVWNVEKLAQRESVDLGTPELNETPVITTFFAGGI